MNYSFLPQKIITIIYQYDNTCIFCKSINTFPLMNTPSSSRNCNNCKKTFLPKKIKSLIHHNEKHISLLS
jgi:hypothetical protein